MQKARNIVGPVVRELREKQGLSQAQLAAKINVHGWDISRETLAKIEAQIRWVADFEILKLAEGFGIEGPELLRKAGQKSKR
jgi:transcriptional regulator with XRE-family HTH domain